jgi:hypothetical protein
VAFTVLAVSLPIPRIVLAQDARSIREMQATLTFAMTDDDMMAVLREMGFVDIRQKFTFRALNAPHWKRFI